MCCHRPYRALALSLRGGTKLHFFAGAIAPIGARGHGISVAIVALSVFREWEGPSCLIMIKKLFAPSLYVTCAFAVSRLSIVPRMNNMLFGPSQQDH